MTCSLPGATDVDGTILSGVQGASLHPGAIESSSGGIALAYGAESVVTRAGELFVRGAADYCRATLATTPSTIRSIAKRNRSSLSPATICAAWVAIKGKRSGGKPVKIL